eukprot:6206049-Pleurochrysis_carterae.AAC.1
MLSTAVPVSLLLIHSIRRRLATLYSQLMAPRGPPNLQATTRQTRLQTAAPTATSTAAPAAASSVSGSGLPPFTADESKRYIVAPELIEATDRKMMTAILQTVTCTAARRSYSLASNGSGRELLRILSAEASAASTATSATIAATIHSLEVRGITEPTVTALNAFIHSIQRLNRSLPSAAQLPDSVLSEKVANAVRRLSDSLSTLLD